MISEEDDELKVEESFESERRAGRADASNPAVLEEMRLWEATLEDGIDFDSPQPDQSKQ
ncbi:MAG TPA: hypothetical protein VGG98_08600 [Solirubrobacteraceae bacterium]|jgi:hypothetical protein